jgi:predicted ATPase
MLLEKVVFKKDYRCFKKDEVINFKDRVTVITGDNGSGKSTLISCIRNCFKTEWSMSDDSNSRDIVETNIDNSNDIEIEYLCLSKDLLSTSSEFGNNISLQIKTMQMSSGQGSLEQLIDKVEKSKNSPILILDEPERGLSLKRQFLVCKYLSKHILENPNQQVIIVTHSDAIMQLSELVYSTSHKDYITCNDYLSWMVTHNSLSSFSSVHS